MEDTGGFDVAETEAQSQLKSQKTRAQKDEHNKRCVQSRAKKKRRFQELQQTETKYNEMVPEFKRLEEMVPKLQAENKKAKVELETKESKIRDKENELQETKRNLMAQIKNLERMKQQFLGEVKPNGKSFISLDESVEWFVSQNYVPDHQVSATSAIDLQNVDESVRLGGNGTANFQPSIAYQQMGFGQDYPKNAAYPAVGPLSVANPGFLTVPDSSLGGNLVFDPANIPENYVKGKSSTSADKFRDLFLSQNYVQDGQVTATSATGLQNVDGFVQSVWNGTANFQPSMAYQQMGSGHDYSKNAAYTSVGHSSVASHGHDYSKNAAYTSVGHSSVASHEYNITAIVASGSSTVANQSFSIVSNTPSTHHGYKAGVLTVPDSSLVKNSVFDPANNLENYVKGKSSTSVEKFRDLFLSQNYVPDGQLTATSATGLKNVDGFVQSGWNGTANFQPSMAYQQMGSGHDYSKNAAYTSVGHSSVASHGQAYGITTTAAAGTSFANQSFSIASDTPSAHNGYKAGVLTVPDSYLGKYSVFYPPNNLENYVKGNSSTSVDKFRDLFLSQNHVSDGQVTATSATGLQNVDGVVHSGLNWTANFQPSMAYQQMASGQDYSKNAAYTAIGPSSVASHGVLAVASSSSGENPEMLCDPTNLPKNYDAFSLIGGGIGSNLF